MCLSAGSSKTASMTASQPARSAASAVGVMRASSASAFSWVVRPRATALPTSFSRVGLALLGRLRRDVLEDDVDAGPGAGVGDAGAHHPGAEHGDLAGRRGSTPAGRVAPALTRLQVEEERLDHVLRDLAGDQLDEVAGLDDERGLEVDLRALDGGGQDVARRRVGRALELLAQVGREGGQVGGERGVDGVPPGIL